MKHELVEAYATVPAGWTLSGWVERLRHMAATCTGEVQRAILEEAVKLAASRLPPLIVAEIPT